MQGRDPQAVATEDQRAVSVIVKREGKLPVEPIEHRFAVLFPHVNEDFRVGMGRKAMPLGLEQLTLLDEVEDFAVEHDHDGFVFVEDRLLSIGQTDDREPARGEGDARRLVETLFVRATVYDGIRHSLERMMRETSLAAQIDQACDAAHNEPFCYLR